MIGDQKAQKIAISNNLIWIISAEPDGQAMKWNTKALKFETKKSPAKPNHISISLNGQVLMMGKDNK